MTFGSSAERHPQNHAVLFLHAPSWTIEYPRQLATHINLRQHVHADPPTSEWKHLKEAEIDHYLHTLPATERKLREHDTLMPTAPKPLLTSVHHQICRNILNTPTRDYPPVFDPLQHERTLQPLLLVKNVPLSLRITNDLVSVCLSTSMDAYVRYGSARPDTLSSLKLQQLLGKSHTLTSFHLSVQSSQDLLCGTKHSTSYHTTVQSLWCF